MSCVSRSAAPTYQLSPAFRCHTRVSLSPAATFVRRCFVLFLLVRCTARKEQGRCSCQLAVDRCGQNLMWRVWRVACTPLAAMTVDWEACLGAVCVKACRKSVPMFVATWHAFHAPSHPVSTHFQTSPISVIVVCHRCTQASHSAACHMSRRLSSIVVLWSLRLALP